MDSISQAALGACVTAACVPAEYRRRALVAGALLGTLPDLDVFIDYGDAVRNFTYHRGFTHSLLVLPGLATLIWYLLYRWWAPVKEVPRHWFIGIFLALITHPLLDAHTAYGTQLFWPFTPPPASWSTLFIIDPAYTVPLLVGVIAAAIWPLRKVGARVLTACLAISVVYIGWTWIGKTLVEREAEAALASAGTEYNAMFSVPTPLNSILWRVVVMTDEGYLEGYDSVLIDEGGMTFTSHASDVQALADANDIWALRRLQWFASGFNRADVIDDRLVLSDLRMGGEPNYVFRHAVAEWDGTGWTEITPERSPMEFDRVDVDWLLHRMVNP